jgi:hypothetical protein
MAWDLVEEFAFGQPPKPRLTADESSPIDTSRIDARLLLVSRFCAIAVGGSYGGRRRCL